MSDTLEPGESASHLLLCEDAAIGIRVGGAVTVPVPPSDDAPKLVFADPKWPLPAGVIARGEFVGSDWADDPAIGMWAEAARPGLDASVVATHAASGRGRVAVLLTPRRVAVGFPRKLLDQPQPSEAKSSGLLMRALDAAVATKTGWDPGDQVHLAHSVPAARVAGFATVQLGRSIPAPTFARIVFTDGSALYIRQDLSGRGDMLLREMNRA